jgi:SAM-dependent methyltransferase
METSTATLRAQLHGMWASVAPSWGEHADYADTRGAAVTAGMLELSAPRPGERVLELACGAGGVGIAAAQLVGPAGEVALSDVAPEMTAIAAARAAALGLGNVRTLTLDLDDLDQPDLAYDVVLCREGLMFALDPAHACRDPLVLRPGGRVALAVWGRGRNLAEPGVRRGQRGWGALPPPGIPGRSRSTTLSGWPACSPTPGRRRRRHRCRRRCGMPPSTPGGPGRRRSPAAGQAVGRAPEPAMSQPRGLPRRTGPPLPDTGRARLPGVSLPAAGRRLSRRHLGRRPCG